MPLVPIKVTCLPPFTNFARGRICESLEYCNEKLGKLVLEAGSVFEIKGQRWMIAALFTGKHDVSMPEVLMFTAKHRQTMKRLQIDAETVPVWFENPVFLSQTALKDEALLSATAKEKLAAYLDEAPLTQKKSGRKRCAPERLSATPKAETVTKKIILARKPKQTIAKAKSKDHDSKLLKLEESKIVTEENNRLHAQIAELKGQLVHACKLLLV